MVQTGRSERCDKHDRHAGFGFSNVRAMSNIIVFATQSGWTDNIRTDVGPDNKCDYMCY